MRTTINMNRTSHSTRNKSTLSAVLSLRLLVFILFLTLVSTEVNAQLATVRGFITSAETGEVMQSVNVQIDDFGDLSRGVVSNGDGFFTLSRLQPGQYRLRASFIGYEVYTDTLTLEPGQRLVLGIEMIPGAVEMEGIAVESERESGAARVTAGLQSVQAGDIELVPAPDVTSDLVSYLSTVPGIVTMGDRGGQVFIRGGEPTQNLTLLDGMDVFQPFHILGFYSAFPSEVISRADIHAGGFGSKHAGRISSVIDVYARNGNKNALSGSAAISPFTSAGRLEGPIIPGRVSFIGVGRFSMLQQLATQYIDSPLDYTFNDVFGKIHASIGNSTQLSVTGLTTYDNGVLTPEEDIFERGDAIRWRNTAVGIRYLTAPRALSILSEVIISYSKLSTEFGPPDAAARTSDLDAVKIALNMTNYAGLSEVSWGFFFRTPTAAAELDGLFQNLISREYLATNAGAYLEPDIYLGGGLFIRPGLLVQSYASAPTSFEPRLRLRWELGKHHISGAAGVYRQQIVGLSDRRDATNIFTAWLQAPRNEAATAVHTLLGYRTEPFSWMEFSIEGFYKSLDHLNVGAWTAFPGFTTRLQPAHGEVAGFDVRVEVRRPWFYGFVNYGYSSTLYEIEPTSEAVFNPGPYRPPHDRKHQLNVLGSTTIYGFDVSVRWQYGSGLPFTQVLGFDGFILMDGEVNVEEVRGFPRVIYDSIPYRAELPGYHRLDVSVERTFELAGSVEMTIHGSVLNAYDRANIFTLDLLTAERTDQLPFVPVLGVKIGF